MDVLFLLARCVASSLVLSLIGFLRTVWFISLGYTCSIALQCVVVTWYTTTVPLVANQLDFYSATSALQLALLFTWAMRLGIFLARRESNIHYRVAVNEQSSHSQGLKLPVKLCIWLVVNVLYVCQMSPAMVVAIVAHDEKRGSRYPSMPFTQIFLAVVGISTMLVGLILESVADYQKSAAKAKRPSESVQSGLFAWVRCPNFLGEILVFTGNYIVALPFLWSSSSWWQWTLATLGLVSIVLIMMGSTRRLERKQWLRYRKQKSFQRWTETVPILVPFVPLYSLQKTRVYLE